MKFHDELRGCLIEIARSNWASPEIAKGPDAVASTTLVLAVLNDSNM